jgi:hypothetical protein
LKRARTVFALLYGGGKGLICLFDVQPTIATLKTVLSENYISTDTARNLIHSGWAYNDYTKEEYFLVKMPIRSGKEEI